MCSCASRDRFAVAAAERELPPPSSVVMDPVPLPPPLRRCDDFRVRADRMEEAAKEANQRLVDSREIYTRVRRRYGAAQ
jgi:hypothetical protein